MFTLPIDHHRLKNDIDTLIADRIRVKTVLRTRPTRPVAEEQRRLVRMRGPATMSEVRPS